MRKRSAYRPKPVLANPLGYVLDTLSPVMQQESVLLDLKIKNSQAMVALMQGRATVDDMDTLIAMSNMVSAFINMGFGTEYKDAAVGGRVAIVSILDRAGKRKKFTPTGPEIQLLNLLMELHDAQMEVVTLGDLEKAIAYVQHRIKLEKHTIKASALLRG